MASVLVLAVRRHVSEDPSVAPLHSGTAARNLVQSDSLSTAVGGAIPPERGAGEELEEP